MSAVLLNEVKLAESAVEVEPEPECECRQTDVDMFDSRYCPLHGPHSEMAREQRQREVDDEFAFYSSQSQREDNPSLSTGEGWPKRGSAYEEDCPF